MNRKALLLVTIISYIHIYNVGFTACAEDETETKEVQAERIVLFSEFGAADFTCTGLTYDAADDAFWLGDYGALHAGDPVRPRLIEVDRAFGAVLREMDVAAVLDASTNLQGVAYDGRDDCLWVAVGRDVAAIGKDGRLLGMIDMGPYAEHLANGIAYDEADDSLWVLCASSYLLHFGKEGALLGEFLFQYAAQDHLCIYGGDLYATVGADYWGRNNYVYKVSMADGRVLSRYRTAQAYALEGLCCVDGKILIANDGLYHLDPIGRSYLSIYDTPQLEE